MENFNEHITTKAKRIFAITAFIALLLWASNLLYALFSFCGGGPEKAGQFGDAFGVINALFSSLAVAAAVGALFLQMYEMAQGRLSRDFQATMTNESHRLSLVSARMRAYSALIESHLIILRDMAAKRDNEFRLVAKRDTLPEEIQGKSRMTDEDWVIYDEFSDELLSAGKAPLTSRQNFDGGVTEVYEILVGRIQELRSSALSLDEAVTSRMRQIDEWESKLRDITHELETQK